MLRQVIPEDLLTGEYLFYRYGATVADYERAATEDARLELLDEVLIMHSPASIRHEDMFAFLLTLIREYATPRGLGRAFGSRAAMYLNDARRFEPDLIFIRSEHLHRLGEVALEGPADLVIEILSRATRDYDTGEKRDAYAEGGVPELWLIDPENRRLLVDRPAGRRHAELAEGAFEPAALPGLQLDVAWLWQEPLPTVSECLRRLNAP